MKASKRGLRQLSGAQVVVIVAAFLALLLGVTVSAPVLRVELGRAGVLDEQDRQVQQQVNDAARVRTDRKAAASLQSLRTAIPPEADLDSALVLFQDAVQRSGSSWIGSSSDPAPPTSIEVDGQQRTVSVYTVSVRMKASPGQVADFLKRVEKLPRLATVDSTVVTSAEATVSLRVYSLAGQR